VETFDSFVSFFGRKKHLESNVYGCKTCQKTNFTTLCETNEIEKEIKVVFKVLLLFMIFILTCRKG
jgi:hypothetical protein